MLLELECDRFICSGVPRGPISFKKGLNAVTGGYSISNSIGKTTFLKVIDFVFGGNDYCVMASVIGEHEVKFAFKFDKIYRFIRKVHTPDCVIKCKGDSYEPDYEISLEEFRKFLLEKYKLEDIGLTFNSIVNPYVRFTKKKCDTEDLLTDFSKECKFKEGVVLEKLFLRYDEVSLAYDDVQRETDNKNKFIDQQQSQLFPCFQINSETYKRNENEINSLKAKLKTLVNDKNYEMTEERLQKGVEIAEINELLDQLEYKRTFFLAQLNKLDGYLKNGKTPRNEDFAELKRYFNDKEINYKSLEEVQQFHGEITSILSDELEEEKKKYSELLLSIDQEIKNLEAKKSNKGLPEMIPVEDFVEYAKIQQRISLLETQNKNSDNLAIYQTRVANEKKKLANVQSCILKEIQDSINVKLAEHYRFIVDQTDAVVPAIHMEDNSNCSFGFPINTGDGDGYKGIIAFDLSILKLTKLPFVIHDSRLFSGVERSHTEKIIEKYSEILEKQVFISIDDIDQYSSEIKKILINKSIISLGPEDKALYGRKFS